jgi:hypothetical protein
MKINNGKLIKFQRIVVLKNLKNLLRTLWILYNMPMYVLSHGSEFWTVTEEVLGS